MKELGIVFVTVFLAELGDKTQLATLLFAADSNTSKWGVFAAASAALMASSLLAVLVGSTFTQWMAPEKIRVIAAIGFIGIGVWMLVRPA